MFKALAQRIARYVLRDELSFYETECNALQSKLDSLIDYDCQVYLDTNRENQRLRRELNKLEIINETYRDQVNSLFDDIEKSRIDLDNASDFANEAMAEIKDLRERNAVLNQRLHCSVELSMPPF
jgi:chromosome segregation ATPase